MGYWRSFVAGCATALPTLALLVVLALGWPIERAASTEAPSLPPAAVEMFTQHMQCLKGSPVWRTLYDLTGDGDLAEIVTYGRGSRTPSMWVYFAPDTDPGVVTHVVFTLPGKPPLRVATLEEADALFPYLCDLPDVKDA